MKVLSVQQPWADLLVRDIKHIENRTWATAHRGPLLIHATKKMDIEGLEWIRMRFPNTGCVKFYDEYVRGAVVGVVELFSIDKPEETTVDHSPFRDMAQFGWNVRDARAFAYPYPYKGKLSIWQIPDQSELVRKEFC